MSARMISSLAEDNKNLQKQIGCMNGLFQLFDRHHFLIGRRLNGQNHKKLLSGATHKMDATNKNKASLSSESSKASSIFDQSKGDQQEQPTCSQSNLPESPSKSLQNKQPSSSSHSARQSPDFRDVVKDSMHREARSLSVKTVTKVEGRVHVMKHIDSPRPFQQSKSTKASPAKSREVPLNLKEDKVGLVKHAPSDHPRFSYDERESREAIRSSLRLKELPRLSLDSREQSFRSSASESRSNFLLGREISNSNRELQCHKRSSSVVAKLMGLEALPNSASSNDIETMMPAKSFPVNDSVSISMKTAEKSKKNQVTRSPQINDHDFSSPRMKPINSTMRAASPSRLPLEPAPWRQQEVSRTSHKSSPKNKGVEVSIKTQQISSSVYGQIEKRITELEFRRSGKDLRALKQILEAMQKTRSRLDSQTEEQADSNANLEIVQKRQQCNLLSPIIKGTRPPKREDTADKKTWRDMASRAKNVRDSGWQLPSPDKKTKGGTSKAAQNPILRQEKEGSYPTLARSSGTVSPRLQQKKKQSYPATTSPEFNRVRRQSVNQSKESGSSKRKPQAKPSNLLRIDEELSEISSSTRNFSEQGDSASVQSESNNSLSSHAEGEVTSRNLSFKVNAKRLEDTKDKSYMLRLNEDNLAIATIEQPSPVSVLDAAFYEEDSPSPVKKKTTAFTVEDAAAGELWYLDYQDHSPYKTKIDLETERLERIKGLIHQLRLLDSNDEANADQLESLSQNRNPDHRYITKILLASGLLKDMDSVSLSTQLHSSSHAIDPTLFYILEQTEEQGNDHIRKSVPTKFNQKMHRKNVFDRVNEILVCKLASESCLLQKRNRLSAQQLLKELKSDIDQLNTKKVGMDSEEDDLLSILNADMTHQSDDWTNCHGQIPSLVLDVERLIFKDLITEIVCDEAREQQIRQRRHCRQLFTK